MQAGETGIIRKIYNPVKNGLEHDPFGNFTKQWIPELNTLPEKLVHTLEYNQLRDGNIQFQNWI